MTATQSREAARLFARIKRRAAEQNQDLTALGELLVGSDGTATDTAGMGAPEMMPGRRAVRFGGKEVTPTGQGYRLLELLLQYVDDELGYDAIDAKVRPGTKGWCGDGAIHQAVRRLRQRLKDGGLETLAEAIREGDYRSYVLHRCWPHAASANVRDGQRRCRTRPGKLQPVE